MMTKVVAAELIARTQRLVTSGSDYKQQRFLKSKAQDGRMQHQIKEIQETLTTTDFDTKQFRFSKSKAQHRRMRHQFKEIQETLGIIEEIQEVQGEIDRLQRAADAPQASIIDDAAMAAYEAKLPNRAASKTNKGRARAKTKTKAKPAVKSPKSKRNVMRVPKRGQESNCGRRKHSGIPPPSPVSISRHNVMDASYDTNWWMHDVPAAMPDCHEPTRGSGGSDSSPRTATASSDAGSSDASLDAATAAYEAKLPNRAASKTNKGRARAKTKTKAKPAVKSPKSKRNVMRVPKRGQESNCGRRKHSGIPSASPVSIS
eukprot:g464.t1